MFRRKRSNQAERALGDCLREEARHTRPAFSESLHQRLRASLLPAVAGREAAARRPIGRPAWVLAGVTMVGLVLCVGIAWHGVVQMRRNSQRQARAAAIAALAALPESAHAGVQEFDRLAGAILAWQQPWAGLEEDAQLAANAVAECFPLRTSRAHAPMKPERLD